MALLAGVSTHYYTRLEQGRDRHPTDAVLMALADVLGLDDAGLEVMRQLAAPSSTRRRRRPAETASPRLVRLLHSWPDNPAVLIGRYRDVLAANPLATLINPGFSTGRNLLRDVFLDPQARVTYPDWHDVAAGAAAAVRATAGGDPDDPRLRELIGELSIASDAFCRMWARHDVRERASGTKRYVTVAAGPLTLQYETFTVVGSPGQTLFVFHADPHSTDEQTLRLLSALIPTPTPTPPPGSDHLEGSAFTIDQRPSEVSRRRSGAPQA